MYSEPVEIDTGMYRNHRYSIYEHDDKFAVITDTTHLYYNYFEDFDVDLYYIYDSLTDARAFARKTIDEYIGGFRDGCVRFSEDIVIGTKLFDNMTQEYCTVTDISEDEMIVMYGNGDIASFDSDYRFDVHSTPSAYLEEPESSISYVAWTAEEMRCKEDKIFKNIKTDERYIAVTADDTQEGTKLVLAPIGQLVKKSADELLSDFSVCDENTETWYPAGTEVSIHRCDSCGNEFDGEFCDSCYCVCDNCRVIKDIKREMHDSLICKDCYKMVKAARAAMHEMSLDTHNVSDSQLAGECVSAAAEVDEYEKYVHSLSEEGALIRYWDNIKKLLQVKYRCNVYDAVRCGSCGELGVEVIDLGDEEDADGVYGNYRAICKHCGIQSLDMDDPAYAVEVLTINDRTNLTNKASSC